MRRIVIIFALVVGALTLAASGLADPGGKGKGKAQGKNKFSFTLTTTDRRCDGTEPWATLNEKRTYQIHDNGNGTFRLRRVDKGTFTTMAGNSPGNCQANKSKHGKLIRAGVTGRFNGYLEGTITGGVFNKNAAPNRSGNRPRLIVRHWQDRGKGSGTTLKESFHGDIASS